MQNSSREKLEREDAELMAQLSDSSVTADPAAVARLAKRHKTVRDQLELLDQIDGHTSQIVELETMLDTEADELRELAATELAARRQQLSAAEAALRDLQRPSDPLDERPAILEIRAGAGGDESSLFARELFGMYQRFAESRGWRVELLSTSPSEAGGYKELIAEVSGAGVFGILKFEGGTHRVQRVPETESQGRVHTSTVTVAVLPKVEERDVAIKPEEVRLDVFRSSGPGGQSVNTTDSAVRITHLPTGITVSCQDEKSQHKNRAKAMGILRARLQAHHESAAAAERGETRRLQVGSGDRSEKIRTYNFPQDRLTDHRIGFTTHGLDKVLAGKLDPILEALAAAAGAGLDQAASRPAPGPGS